MVEQLTLNQRVLGSSPSASTIFNDLGKRASGFVRLRLELEDDCALTVPALIITATPGTMWVVYYRLRSGLLVHLLDMIDEEEWIHQNKARYDALLMRIFGA